MNKEKILKILDFLIPIVSVAVILAAGIYLYRVNRERSIADEEYAAIEEAAGVSELPESMDIEETSEDEEIVDEYKQTFFNIHVNFDALKNINEDVIGWIYIPSIGLSYPVLKGEDNNYYLHHTMEGTANSSGSIFMDAESDSDMRGFNTFFYGHAMKNGTMFGSLKEFLKNPETIDNNPYIYYFTEDHAYKYRIIATYITHQGSNTYMISETKEQFYNYMQKV
ncbi:MAG: class B sortase, partial [Lachnospiraceae bacterium]|nr:class B sortase [Lachnospiraceae bacterium]